MISETSKKISARMRLIRKKDTKPELVVRRLLYRLGYRYRLHWRELPGSPDIVFPLRKKVIFVHGCFWHQHTCRLGSKQPKANRGYWLPKLSRNRSRDVATEAALTALGWSVLVVWECETQNEAGVARRVSHFLGPPRSC